MLKDTQDAFGHAMFDYLSKKQGHEIVERDDGYVDVSGGPQCYFNEYKDWAPHVKQAMLHVRGQVLDIGCGAGRHTLFLQRKGFSALGIDNSPLAVKVCKLRGVKKARLLPISKVTYKLGIFDTIIMLGNNFGLFGSREKAKRILKRFDKITSNRARIIAESNDPYQTTVTEHLWYHRFNRKRKKMSGQLRIRVRYKKYVTPWFDYLIVSKDEMKLLLKGTAWEVKRFIDSSGSAYIAIIGKK